MLTKQEALAAIEAMSEAEFNGWLDSLPERVKLLVKSGAVSWRDCLPDWYIKRTLDKEIAEAYANPRPAVVSGFDSDDLPL